MRTLAFLSILIVADVLAGCGGRSSATLPDHAVSSLDRHSAPTYHIVYAFQNVANGWSPASQLIDVHGLLYGTTESGGTKDYGTVFSATTTGAESVLHSFGTNHPDGVDPQPGVVDINGTVYGTTLTWNKRSSYYCGTAYGVTTTQGVETMLHPFNQDFVKGRGFPKGCIPSSPLIEVNGALYGVTLSGGNFDEGVIYRVTTAGQERVLYSFGAAPGEGSMPEGGLLDVDDTLYGTTSLGGNFDDGTIFSYTRPGKVTYVHSFAGINDGEDPEGGLIDVDGTLYGTTRIGGSANAGTVYSLIPGGKHGPVFRVVYQFGKDSNDGRVPTGRLVSMNGILYGTTERGGASDDGTVFGITKDGVETVLHSFGSGGDGYAPVAGLLNVDGTLYGTTLGGGPGGEGTIFALRP